MKILTQDFKHGFVKLHIETLDDLWYLSHIIEPSDTVRGQTERKIKLGGGEERNAKIVVKKITLSLVVEKVEFHTYAHTLRVSGKTSDEHEEIPKGSYHTLALEPGIAFGLTKHEFLQHHIEQLKEASVQKPANVLLCALERDHVTFALLQRHGYLLLGEISGEVQKKDVPEKVQSTFYRDVVRQLQQYVEQRHIEQIVVGSPAFWKDYLIKELEGTSLKGKVITATCHSSGEAGIRELLKRSEVLTALHDDRVLKEVQLVEELLVEISKRGDERSLATYGVDETARAVEMGAVEQLLITDGYLQETRRDGGHHLYHRIDALLKNVDRARGKIMIISSDHDGGKKLDGLGGIGALLRYKINN